MVQRIAEQMLDKIVAALSHRPGLSAWSVRQVQTHGTQLYAVPKAVEAIRTTSEEKYVVNVFRPTVAPDGSAAIGNSRVTLLPGEDVNAALDNAALMAGLIHNKPYGVPGPQALPDVMLADPRLQNEGNKTLSEFLDQLRSAVALQKSDNVSIRMTAAECYAEEVTSHLCNSRGIDASQVETRFSAEWVLMGQRGDKQTESFVEFTRRRVSDLDVAAEIERGANHTIDLLDASAPPDYEGPVVIRGGTLAGMLIGDTLSPNPIQTLSSGESKFAGTSRWEIGQSVFKDESKGDPLTMWANRQLAYGVKSDRFDDEGLPAQRLLLIENNVLKAFVASQRYADYLSIPPTGEWGNVEVQAGRTPAADLLSEPHIEVVQFSWFDPNPVTGDFASEIRLGYVVKNGQRTPFKGGMLVGNLIDALGNVHWSAETAFYGRYQGPATARFGSLKIAGG